MKGTLEGMPVTLTCCKRR